MWRAWAFTLAALAAGCSNASSEQNPNELDGLASLFGGNYPTPKTKSPTELTGFKTKLQTYLHSGARPESPRPAPRASLNRAIFETLKDQEGLPRWQLRQILKGFLAPDNTACGGAGCARVFDLNAHGVDNYLDSLYKEIQRTSRPRSAALEKLRDILLGSLKRDYELSSGVPGSQPVKFKTFASSAWESPERADKAPTYDQLNKVEKLTLHLATKLGEDVKDDFSDLMKYGGLTHLIIVTNNGKMIRQIAPYADRVQHLEIHNISFNPFLKLEDLAPLATLPSLKSLKLSGMKIDHIGMVRDIFPQLRSLTISGPYYLPSDDFMRQLEAFRSLRAIHFEGLPIGHFSYLSVPLPRQITEASYSPVSLSDKISAKDAVACPNLADLRYFARVSSMSIKGCAIADLKSLTSPVNWQILRFERCRSNSPDATNLRVTGQFPNLLAVDIDNSLGLELDPISRHDLAVRLALTKKAGKKP